MYKHKPYPPTTAGLGGTPTPGEDGPILAVFISLFLLGAITHMTILQVNLRRGQKFMMSGMLFGFCMARVVACSIRLALSTHQHNISVAIAAQIFVAIGVVLIFIINLIFAQRIVRASHPHFGWAKWFSWAFKLYYVSIVLNITMLVTCIVQSFYTLSNNTRRIDRDVELVGTTYFAVTAFLPTVLVLLRVVIPRKAQTEKFGTGHFNTKFVILLCSSLLLTFGATFRAVTQFFPRPVGNPAWYQSKSCFYLVNFTIEWLVVLFYAIIRVDKRFWIPNHAHGPGDYTVRRGSIAITTVSSRKGSFVFRVLSEEHVFDEMTPEEEAESIERTLTRRRSSVLGRTWSRRSSSATARRWTPRMSIVSRAWTRRTTSGDVEAPHGGEHTIDSVAKPAATGSPNPAHSQSSTDVGSSSSSDSDSE
jgi:hypothetical protein